jgi:hypothetical protein
LDVVATIAALTEQPISNETVMDSIDLMPLLKQEEHAKGHEILLHVKYSLNGGNKVALRQGNWKLHATFGQIVFDDAAKGMEIQNVQATHLFNLETNPTEDIINGTDYIDDLATEHVQRRSIMIELIHKSVSGSTIEVEAEIAATKTTTATILPGTTTTVSTTSITGTGTSTVAGTDSTTTTTAATGTDATTTCALYIGPTADQKGSNEFRIFFTSDFPLERCLANCTANVNCVGVSHKAGDAISCFSICTVFVLLSGNFFCCLAQSSTRDRWYRCAN